MFESSTIEISRSALTSNLEFIRKQIGHAVKFCSIVKGNAYGHGLNEFVSMAMDAGVTYFGVYSADEAWQLLQHAKRKPEVYIMSMIEGDAIAWAIEHGVEFCVYDLHRLHEALQTAQRMKTKAKIHVEVETGMHRTGFEDKELGNVCDVLLDHPDFFELKGVCTHFAGAESMANNFRVSEQVNKFQYRLQLLQSRQLVPQYQHMACSAAIMNYPQTISDMVRVGIMQYGFWPNQETFIRYTGAEETNEPVLKRVITWKSRIAGLKEVAKGNFIGYGTSYLAHQHLKIALVPVGYAHGYSRNLSNTGQVLVRGQVAPVTGIVNMNAVMVDVTGIEGVEKGDEVVLIGAQNDKTISVFSFSELSQQLNYEMLTRLSGEIPRIIVD